MCLARRMADTKCRPDVLACASAACVLMLSSELQWEAHHPSNEPSPTALYVNWIYRSTVLTSNIPMHYTPHIDLAFSSVERIMCDMEGGWLLCYMHANGAKAVTGKA